MKKTVLIILCAALIMASLAGCDGWKNGRADATLPSKQETEGSRVLAEPPVLTLTAESGTAEVHFGTGSWSYDEDGNEDQAAAFIACGLHPLDYVDLKPIVISGEYLDLSFSSEPDSLTVTRWDDDYLGDNSALGEEVPVEGGRIPCGCSGYIYQVRAVWEDCGRGYHGNAEYVFYAISSKARTPAAEPQTVEDPVTGYCGNIVTTVYLDGEKYSFMYDDSVAITDILINLAYDPNKLCNCMHEFEISIDGSEAYEVNLTEYYVRSPEGQADLTQAQADTIRAIIEKLN